MDEEKKEVLSEAEKIYDVEKVIPSIYLASELSEVNLTLFIINNICRISSYWCKIWNIEVLDRKRTSIGKSNLLIAAN